MFISEITPQIAVVFWHNVEFRKILVTYSNIMSIKWPGFGVLALKASTPQQK